MSFDSRNEQLRREIHRLRTSPSLRLGSHITDAIRKPWRAPFLLVTLPWLMLHIGMEMLGLKVPPGGVNPVSGMGSQIDPQTILFFPTNGVGFGHFTRMLAVAKRIKKKSPRTNVVFFTTMPTLHILKFYGIPAHHIAGPKYFPNLSTPQWNSLLEEELRLCLDTHMPSLFMFDGAFPYRGMLRAIQDQTRMKKIWMRRRSLKKGTRIPVDSINHFDQIINPSEGTESETAPNEYDVEELSCPPIVMIDRDEMFTRSQARNRLGLPTESVVVYVQLGAGEINNIQSEIRMTIEALLSNPGLYVVLGESLIGHRIKFEFNSNRVRILKDYPNSIYFNAFDASVQAGGYNSFHEARVFGIPTLFFPNMNTGMDDQLTRCSLSEEEDWGIVLKRRTKTNIQSACDTLISRVGHKHTIDGDNGADTVANLLLEALVHE